MAQPEGGPVDRLLLTLVSAFAGGEGTGSLAPFWDRLVAEGYTTSSDDARRVLAMVGAYDDPRVPFTRSTPTRVGGVDTEHKRAIMRVTANIREAQRRQRTGGSLREKTEADRMADIRTAVRRALAAGVSARLIDNEVRHALMRR